MKKRPRDDILFAVMSMDSRLFAESRETVERVIAFARDKAFQVEGVDLSPCYQREKNRAFMAKWHLLGEDLLWVLARLRPEEYWRTSKEVGKEDAHIFSVQCPGVEEEIYLKFEIVEGVLVLSFHEPDRPMEGFPFRKRKDQGGKKR